MTRRSMMMIEPFVGSEPFQSFLKYEADDAANTWDASVPKNLVTANDSTGNSRTGTCVTTAGPFQAVGVINGIDAFGFDGTVGNGTITCSNSLALRRNRTRVGITLLIQPLSLAALNLTLQCFPSTTGNGFTLSITTAGKILISTRRVAADGTNVNYTSTLTISTTSAHILRVWVDFMTGDGLIQLDDNLEPFQMVSPGHVGWPATPYLGRTEDVDSSAAPTFGRVGAVILNAYVSYIHIWYGTMTQDQADAEFNTLQVKYATPVRTLTLPTQPENLLNMVHQRDALGGKTLSRTVNVLTGADSDIEARIINATTRAVVVNWTNIGATVGGTGTFNIAFPDGSNKIQYRKVGEAEDAAVEDTDRIGVGGRLIVFGNSIGSNMSALGSATNYASATFPITSFPPAETTNVMRQRRFSWTGHFQPAQKINTTNLGPGTGEIADGPTAFEAGGNAIVVMLLRLEQLSGYPWEALFFPVGGSYLPEWTSGGVYFDRMKGLLDAGPGWDCSFVLSCSGVGETFTPTITEAEVITKYTDVISSFRAETGNATLTVYITPNARIPVLGAATDSSVDEVLLGQLAMPGIDANVKIVGYYNDMPNTDAAHFSVPNMIKHVERIVYDIADDQGWIATGAGYPSVTSAAAAIGGTDIILTLDPGAGTTIVDASDDPAGTGITGFDLIIDGTVYENISSSLSSNTVVIPSPVGAITGGMVIQWRYQEGLDYDVTKPVYCDSAYGEQVNAPLPRTVEWQSVTVS